MNILRVAPFVFCAVIFAGTPANAQYPGASDFNNDNVVNPDSGDAYVVPLVTVPFGAPFPAPRARLFSGRAQALQTKKTPAQYNQCLQDQSNDPVRAINCD
jgi:hypothetical protein